MVKPLLVAIPLVLLALPAHAQGTPAQRAACEQDAFRLCQNAIPDADRVRQCLVRNMRRLNPTCRSAFTARGRR